jgi:intein-encoded DNA endonuclease-like protein
MEKYVIEDLLEFTKERNEHESQSSSLKLEQHAVTRVDKMKINSMEIIISFYQNTHAPMNDINKFVLGEE